ncbi:MAG: signal peptidase II, partial [Oscillospiraceae bacterium]|nr:signal peptidase II [Oscillospiraceae bacterium]
MKQRIYYLLVFVFWFALDQIAKVAVCNSMEVGDSFAVIPHIAAITYVRNTGVSFSLFDNSPVFMGIVNVLAAVICAGILVYIVISKRTNGRWYLYSGLALIAAGGIGNFADRMRLGYVIDMFEPLFVRFAVFNVADIGLTFGAI